MAQYKVDVKEVHIVTLFVEATSDEEARAKANVMIEDSAGDGEYSYTIGSDAWNIQRCE